MYIKSWNVYDEETKGSLTFKEVKTRFCTEKDFNNKEGSISSSKFLKTDSFSERAIYLYGNSFKCVEDDGIFSIHGNYDSS